LSTATYREGSGAARTAGAASAYLVGWGATHPAPALTRIVVRSNLRGPTDRNVVVNQLVLVVLLLVLLLSITAQEGSAARARVAIE